MCVLDTVEWKKYFISEIRKLFVSLVYTHVYETDMQPHQVGTYKVALSIAVNRAKPVIDVYPR